MMASRKIPSPCKGEVGRAADGRGSQRFNRTPAATARARRLRSRMTDAETKLWQAVRRDKLCGLNFRRQHPIGNYVLDFYCPQIRLAVEVDGGQHSESQTRDERRTRILNQKGILVVRYWNNEVLGNFEGVLAHLTQNIQVRAEKITPSLTLPLSGGGKRKGAGA